jgi:hypothetical protein
MKEADPFRQYAEDAMRWSSKSAYADQKWALVSLACRYAQAGLMSQGVCWGQAVFRRPVGPALKETHPVF